MTQVHFIGIGGSGLSAIARLMLEQGYTVTGSDRTLSPLALELQKAGVRVYLGHAPAQVQGSDWVVRSSAVPDENPEVQEALRLGIPVYKRADFLGQMMQAKTGIAIAGTHGKTTTTGMVAWALEQLGASPSFIVGGVMKNLGANARAGQGEHFVIEADEYDRMFLGLKPRIAVVTNVEHDHPDCYPTAEDFYAAFLQFIELLPANGALVACGEDKGANQLMADARARAKRVVGYRIAESARTEAGEWVLAQNIMVNQRGGFTFNCLARLQAAPGYVSAVQLQMPGLHNVRNALATLAVMGLLGYNLKDAAEALSTYEGTGRRFDLRGEAGGVTVIDDYAHHPTEIRTTLDAARARYPSRRIVAVWQPHTYSRTQTLFEEFAASFPEADEVIVSEVYVAREPAQDFSAERVVKAMNHPSAHFLPTLAQITAYLQATLRPGDVLMVLSAGDADQVSTQVLQALQEKEASQ